MSESRKAIENKKMNDLIDGKGKKSNLKPAYEDFVGQTSANINLVKSVTEKRKKGTAALFKDIFDEAEVKQKKARTIYFDPDIDDVLKEFKGKISQLVNDSMRRVLEDQGYL